MFKQILILIGVTLIPALELRASIPYGIFGSERFGIVEKMPWLLVVAVCILANIVLGLMVFWLMDPVMKFMDRFKWFKTKIEPILERARKKLHPYVEKYGEIGVALFIGVPLPGSGVYTGAVGAYLLGLDKKKFAIANLIGVLIAGTAVALICLFAEQIPWVDFFIKREH